MDWNKVKYTDGNLTGEVLPPDGKWLEWLDVHGNIECARFKYDIIDHFYPNTSIIDNEEDVVAWRYHSN